MDFIAPDNKNPNFWPQHPQFSLKLATSLMAQSRPPFLILLPPILQFITGQHSDLLHTMSKVYSIVINVRLDCEICYKKISKAICSICACGRIPFSYNRLSPTDYWSSSETFVYIPKLQSKCFNEKENTVTITGTFDPQKVMKSLCRKAGKWILAYEVIEVKKEEEKAPEPDPKPAPAPEPAPPPPAEPAPPPAPEPAPAPPPEPAPPPPPAEDDGGKDKCQNGKKNGKKNGKSKKVVFLVLPSKDPPPPPPAPAPAPPPDPAPEQPPPPPDPKPEPTPPPPEPKPEPPAPEKKPEPPIGTPYALPTFGAPAHWCTCGPCHCGCYYRACYGVREIAPCACACSYRRHHGYHGQKCEFFSEEDPMCRLM
ncbi:hypothetical protein EJ110_NYTH27838 [Nymphaea thermarum]|nr:hypothetical protein EJ110_NYTH27838 [Nymphaea thermarum]